MEEKNMKDKLFRVVKPDEHSSLRQSLRDAPRDMKLCYQPSKEPINSGSPHGEWCCENQRCVVRNVQIKCSLIDQLIDPSVKMPEEMKCPVCQGKLKFITWFGSEFLVECEGEPAKE
jgi:hypothetical protein